MFLNLLNKSKSLRIVNLAGLSLIFAALLLSYGYIHKELSYDRFHEKAERIVRFSLQHGDNPLDGRNYRFSENNNFLNDIPGIEDILCLVKVNTGVLVSQGEPTVINDFYFASSNFFQVFDYPLLQGNSEEVLNSSEKVVISERLAQQLFGNESALGKEIRLEGRRFSRKTLFVSGVFENFPENSHFHTDLIIHRPSTEASDWSYVYLLLNEHTPLDNLFRDITGRLDELNKNSRVKNSSYLVPLTDIHLHSHVQREMEFNGNIGYIYLVGGANILLLVIVFFNLWLNAGLTFAANRRYYQLLRLNGASSSTVLKDESLLALAMGVVSIGLGGVGAYYFSSQLGVSLSFVSAYEWVIAGLLFICLVWFVSVLPAITGMSSTLFFNTERDIRPLRFSLSNIRYLLIAQYCIVMFIVIIAFGISRQMNLIKTTQVGGKEQNILATTDEQPLEIQKRFEVLRTELLKHSEIESVTTAMQLPGSAIGDGIMVVREGEDGSERKNLPIIVVGNDFLPFFRIPLISGSGFQPDSRSWKEEWDLMSAFQERRPLNSNLTEDYVINKSAVKALGFQSPEDAVGKYIAIDHPSLDYISKGTIVGVTDDFTYTTLYENSIPLVILQRQLFMNSFFVRFSPDDTRKGLAIFNQVWKNVYPDYPANYSFLQEVYSRVYHNEENTQSLVWLFSLLSLLIANLGLIIVMAFVIKRKTKEIGIRRINGATFWNIIWMLNIELIIQISVAFLIAIPVAWYVISRWLENFAYKITLNGWIFVFAGLFVLLLSVAAVSLQSWRAAHANPVDSLKIE
jgi:putative ABC transport system permease protein